MVSIIGYYTTQFGELWEKSLFDLASEAIRGVLKSSSVEASKIDAVFFGNMLAGRLENNLHSGSKVAELLKTNCPVFRVENACASGGVAFHLGYNYIKSGAAKTVLILGAEKMTDVSPEAAVSGLAGAASGEEQEAGLTFAGLYAMMANIYMSQFNVTEEDLAAVSVKNHFHGSLNEKAHFRNKVTTAKVLKSPLVASPLKVLDCSPISDGAAALILSSDEKLIAVAKKTAKVLATESACDSISLKDRENLFSIKSTVLASQKAYAKSGVSASSIRVAEVHDCFSIAEFIAMEDLGFCSRGEAKKVLSNQQTTLGKSDHLVVNTSGGLKASGHPVGATGVKQIGEVFLQLTGQAGERQVRDAKFGLAHNVGGSGGTAVVTIMQKQS